jgi:hypothetical protein
LVLGDRQFGLRVDRLYPLPAAALSGTPFATDPRAGARAALSGLRASKPKETVSARRVRPERWGCAALVSAVLWLVIAGVAWWALTE